MNEYYLQSQMKSEGTGLILAILFGCHYVYMGKIVIQILFWITFGGLFIWYFIDIFRVQGMIRQHNMNIAGQIDMLKLKEKVNKIG